MEPVIAANISNSKNLNIHFDVDIKLKVGNIDSPYKHVISISVSLYVYPSLQETIATVPFEMFVP